MTPEEIAGFAAALRAAIESAVPLSPKVLFTCTEAAEVTGLPKSFFEDESAGGRIPSRKIGKYRRFTRADLDAIIEVCAAPPSSGPHRKDFRALEKRRKDAA